MGIWGFLDYDSRQLFRIAKGDDIINLVTGRPLKRSDVGFVLTSTICYQLYFIGKMILPFFAARKIHDQWLSLRAELFIKHADKPGGTLSNMEARRFIQSVVEKYPLALEPIRGWYITNTMAWGSILVLL